MSTTHVHTTTAGVCALAAATAHTAGEGEHTLVGVLRRGGEEEKEKEKECKKEDDEEKE